VNSPAARSRAERFGTRELKVFSSSLRTGLQCICFLAVALWGSSPSAYAQATPPDIGTTLRETEPPATLTPTTPAPALDIPKSESAPSASSAASASFPVQRIRVTGSSVFPASRLEQLLSDVSQRDTSLTELRQAAQRITDFYRQHGLPLARAYLPAQEIKDGVVELAVLEGRYGKLDVTGEARVSESLIQHTLKSVKPGAVIRMEPLERDLLLLNELHGMRAVATLEPGENAGTADLILHITPYKRLQGSLEADNSGNRYTGQLRLGGTLAAANLAGRGDLLSLRGMLTDGRGVLHGRTEYQMPMGGNGLRMGASVALTDYTLGKQFSALDAHGDATVTTLHALYPLSRSPGARLDADVALGYADLRDVVNATSTSNRRWSREVTFSVSGVVHDEYLAGAVTGGSVSYTGGELRMRDPTAALIDQATARTTGHYDKMSLTAFRQQRLGEAAELFFALSGQLGGKNLDPSEKFDLGGPDAVRAYPQGEGVGDSGVLGTAEMRYAFPAFGTRAQAVAFVDAGRIRVNENSFAAGENQRSLYGAGVGVNLYARGGLAVRGSWAWKLGSEPALSDTDDGSRGWVQVVRKF
jgi:hemolysin activation/secretion protein